MLWPKLFIRDYLIGKLNWINSFRKAFVLAHYSIWFVVNALKTCCPRLVNKINNTIGQDPNSKVLIGVLDIYGFESFKTNRCLTGTLLLSSFKKKFSCGELH